MTAAGWYRGEGDPPGTQRYWDGTQWVGDPVYEPVAAPVPPPPPPGGAAYTYATPVVASAFPSGLKVIAIVLSVLKAIPLVFFGIAVIFLAGVSNDIEDEFGDIGLGLDGLLGAAIAIFVVLILVGGLLLGFQLAGAIKERPIMLFVPALVMALLDALLTLGAWTSYSEAQNDPFLDEGPGGPVFITIVAAAQIYVAVQAIRANRA